MVIFTVKAIATLESLKWVETVGLPNVTIELLDSEHGYKPKEPAKTHFVAYTVLTDHHCICILDGLRVELALHRKHSECQIMT